MQTISLTIYGSVVLALMMVFYTMEARNPKFILLFAVTCFLSSAYGFISTVYPFFVIELIWGIFAIKRYSKKVRNGNTQTGFSTR